MISRRDTSERQLRVSQLIKIALIDALKKHKVQDVRIRSDNVMVTHVDITSDLRLATCYVRLFDINKTELLSESDLLKVLEEQKYILRKWIAASVVLKYVPDIKFCYDNSADNLNAIEQLLQNLKK